MKLIDKYVLKRFLGSFFFVVLVIVAVIVIIDITEKIDDFGEHEDLTLYSIIFDYYLNFIPFIANMITPLTTFIATVFVTAKMAGQTEIIAILSSGVSFKRFMLPYLIGSIIIATISFALTGWIIPESNKEKVKFEVQYIKGKFYYSDRNIHIQVSPDVYLYMQSYSNQSNVGNRFTMERLVDTQLKEKLTAKRIEWDEEKNKWTLKNWQHRLIDGMSEVITEGVEKDTTLIILPEEFENKYSDYMAMTIGELNAEIDKLTMRGASNVEVYEVEKYIRYSSPFSVLILTFMGVIVAARKSRGGTGLRIAMGFFLSFIFIIFFILSKTIAETGSLHPAFSVWIPNLIFTGISLFMYRYLPR
jgi:lipopolysaccharide export system permease protein